MEPLLLALENAGRHGGIVAGLVIVLVVGGSIAWLASRLRSREDSSEVQEHDQTRGGGAS